jgi:hypothetical protein
VTLVINDPFILAFTHALHLFQISQQTFRNIFTIGNGFLFGDGKTVIFLSCDFGNNLVVDLLKFSYFYSFLCQCHGSCWIVFYVAVCYKIATGCKNHHYYFKWQNIFHFDDLISCTFFPWSNNQHKK